MKKLLLLTLVMMLCMTQGFAAFADEAQKDGSNTEAVYEFDYIMDLISKSDDQLRNEGCTEEMIEEIRSFDLEEYCKYHLENIETRKAVALNESDNERLMLLSKVEDKMAMNSLGSNDQFNGEETLSDKFSRSELRAFGAKVNLSHNLQSYRYIAHNDITSAIVWFNWNWTSKPFFTGKDIIGFAWTDGFYCSLAHQTINFANGKSKVSNMTYDGLHVIDDVFTMSYSYHDRSYATDGHGAITLFTNGQAANFQMAYSYGHSIISFNPSISVSASGPAIGVGFTGQTHTYKSETVHN